MSDKKKNIPMFFSPKDVAQAIKNPMIFDMIKDELPVGCASVMMETWGNKVSGEDLRNGILCGFLGSIFSKIPDDKWEEAFGGGWTPEPCGDPECNCIKIAAVVKTAFGMVREIVIKEKAKCDLKNGNRDESSSDENTINN